MKRSESVLVISEEQQGGQGGWSVLGEGESDKKGVRDHKGADNRGPVHP